MPDKTFKALLLEQVDGKMQAGFKELPTSALPEGEVLVAVTCAGLNYKDGLSLTGRGKIARTWPMVPGIELVGTVVESAAPEFRPGDRVYTTGWGLGETRWGGFAELARVQAGGLVSLPAGLTPVQAAGIGTAGITAMLSVMALQAHGRDPGQGPVVVTGASGGVGGMAILLLAQLGYRVVASTGRTHLQEYLAGLGAAEVMDRRELAGPPGKPLDRRRWAAAVDTVGGDTLATLLTMLDEDGSVAACGLAGGAQLNTTVYPFILRGVNLLGIDSSRLSRPRLEEIWRRLVQDLPLDRVAAMVQTAPLSEVFDLGEQIVAGQVRGRVVLQVQG